ncbi:hypothetical protein DET49_12248 [Salegentibacter sp. 24]|uniref:hypothetical protein n=1 Tax=Salegentibacter sp. 24 TaxID=2183986 RepID=UPI00105F883A|nr:hypothetical protein [Salegentibacter sp. 24]TDN83078.1 hypothetical protein DET49_12248 [Salegentibacter sp. 24]
MKKKKLPYHPKTGFTIPSSYFEGLQDELVDMVKLSESLEDKKSTGFRVPVGYFDGLEDEFLEKAIKKEPKIRTLFSKEVFFYAASIAAIVIAFASTFYINPQAQTSWKTVELSAMENYIDNNDMGFSTGEMSQYFFEQGFVVDDTNLNQVDAETMKNYLEENIDEPLYMLDED